MYQQDRYLYKQLGDSKRTGQIEDRQICRRSDKIRQKNRNELIKWKESQIDRDERDYDIETETFTLRHTEKEKNSSNRKALTIHNLQFNN